MTRQDQWIFLDNYRRKLFVKGELKARVLRGMSNNGTLTASQKLLLSLHKSFTPNSASVNKPNNRCVLSGRKHNVFRKTQASRFVFRRFLASATLPGIRRYSR